MRAVHRVQAAWAIGVVAAAVWACESARNPGGIQRDITPPNITLTVPSGRGDTPTNPDTQPIAGGLKFTVNASDNLSLKTIRLTYSGGYLAGPIDTTFFTQTTKITLPEVVTFPSNSGAGGLVQIVGRAIDGAGNFAEDTLYIVLSNVSALKVFLIAPVPGAVASTGRNIPVSVVAVQNQGIRKIGFLVAPPTAVTNPTTPPNDSIIYSIPYADSVNYVDTLTVVATSGFFSIVGFAEDSAGRRATSGVVTVSVLSAANDTTPPSVTHTIGTRVEVTDNITVHATDPSAISWIGFRVDTIGGTTPLRFDTINVSAGNLTDVTRIASLGLGALIPANTLPKNIIVRGYACDLAVRRNCSYSEAGGVPLAAPKADTILVVAGVTRALPAGSHIGDAIYDKNTNELYLTNTPFSRVEIFQVANTAFVAGGIITAGPFPVGVALWPRDTLGNYGDTIVVANTGGTELSVIDVRAAARQLVWRQDLPDFLIETYKVIQSGGIFRVDIEVFDVSDRPQYVATVCRPAGGTACAKDSIFAVYSTTPTASSTSPFSGKGTIRMEKLRNPAEFGFNPDSLFGHLFWEIAGDSTLTSLGNDTLRIELRRGLPYNSQQVVLSACRGVMVQLSRFGLGDSTFVRNSGNFTHAFFGEGGNVSTQFARVMNYSTRGSLRHGAPTFLTCATSSATTDAGFNDSDNGMSPAIDVSDFISNTGVKIVSIATNFNGGTNLVRADSVYVLDEGLRLKGTACPLTADGLSCVQGAAGMDMNYNHNFAAGTGGTPAFGGTGSPNNREMFVARPDGNIDVFDTFFYGKIASIPIRDPIVGPLRVALDPLGNQLLFGVTTTGLVMVQLPTVIANPFPIRAGVRGP
jgi:hypothetical protein